MQIIHSMSSLFRNRYVIKKSLWVMCLLLIFDECSPAPYRPQKSDISDEKSKRKNSVRSLHGRQDAGTTGAYIIFAERRAQEDIRPVRTGGRYIRSILPQRLMKAGKVIDKEIKKGFRSPMSGHPGTSHPVIRMENGKAYLAAYQFSYTREDLAAKQLARPMWYCLADIESGRIIKRISCADGRDFSTAAFDGKYDISALPKTKADDNYYNSLFEYLDEARRLLTETNDEKLYMEPYRLYLRGLTDIVPESYRRFYCELSIPTDISGEKNTADGRTSPDNGDTHRNNVRNSEERRKTPVSADAKADAPRKPEGTEETAFPASGPSDKKKPVSGSAVDDAGISGTAADSKDAEVPADAASPAGEAAESPADTPAGNAPQSPEVSPTDRMRIIKEIMITHEKDGQVTGDAPSGQPAPEFHEDRTEELTDDCRNLCGGEDGATNGVPQETDKTEECPPNPERPPAPQKDGTSPVIPVCGALAALLEAEAGAFPFLGMYGSGFTAGVVWTPSNNLSNLTADRTAVIMRISRLITFLPSKEPGKIKFSYPAVCRAKDLDGRFDPWQEMQYRNLTGQVRKGHLMVTPRKNLFTKCTASEGCVFPFCPYIASAYARYLAVKDRDRLDAEITLSASRFPGTKNLLAADAVNIPEDTILKAQEWILAGLCGITLNDRRLTVTVTAPEERFRTSADIFDGKPVLVADTIGCEEALRGPDKDGRFVTASGRRWDPELSAVLAVYLSGFRQIERKEYPAVMQKGPDGTVRTQ